MMQPSRVTRQTTRSTHESTLSSLYHATRHGNVRYVSLIIFVLILSMMFVLSLAIASHMLHDHVSHEAAQMTLLNEPSSHESSPHFTPSATRLRVSRQTLYRLPRLDPPLEQRNDIKRALERDEQRVQEMKHNIKQDLIEEKRRNLKTNQAE